MEVTQYHTLSLLPSINDCISIDIVLARRCAKFIWSCLNSYNTIIKTTVLSAISSGCSTLGDNYRYLSYKYNIGPHIWMLSLNEVIKCISLYISTNENLLHSVHGTIVRDFCLARDNYYQTTHLFSHAEINMLIDFYVLHNLIVLLFRFYIIM